MGPENDPADGDLVMSTVLAEKVQPMTTGKASTPEIRILKVCRYDPSMPENPSKMTGFLFPVTKGMTVLDALLWVKEHTVQGLAFRCSCRMGICGSCGILINGEPKLACETQIAALPAGAIEVAPLSNFPVIRDLATEFQGVFSHHRQVMPYLIRKNEAEMPERELLQTEEEKLRYYQFTMCIMCGLCNAACPIVGIDQDYLGPQALTQAYRFAIDSRDEGWAKRRRSLDSAHGCWGCKLAGSCSSACPKGVDPALAIQLLKRKVLPHWVKLDKRRR